MSRTTHAPGGSARQSGRAQGRRTLPIMMAALLPLILAGCAVGPDFHLPRMPWTTSYTATPMRDETASADRSHVWLVV